MAQYFQNNQFKNFFTTNMTKTKLEEAWKIIHFKQELHVTERPIPNTVQCFD